MVLESDGARVALVVCDLLGAHRAVFDHARKLVEKGAGIPAAHLFMSCTHTHSAVNALGDDRFVNEAPLDDFQRFVAERIADAVQCAVNNLQPAEIGWCSAQEPREVFNRRWFLKPGTMPPNPFGKTTDRVKMNPARASADLDRPAGPTDPEISCLVVRHVGGKPLALYASYSLHYVGGVRGSDVSADYFGMFCSRMEQLLGARDQDPPFVAMLANGTSANINNIDFTKAAEKLEPYEKMRQVADRVATATHAALERVEWHKEIKLSGRLEYLDVAQRKPTEEEVASAKAILAKEDGGIPTDLGRVYAESTMAMAGGPDSVSLPLQVVRIGEMAIGGVPGEVFVETGLDFKQRSPRKPSFIVSLNNGYYGYIPTPEQHDLGGYETWLGTNRLERTAATKILNRLLEMVASSP